MKKKRKKDPGHVIIVISSIILGALYIVKWLTLN